VAVRAAAVSALAATFLAAATCGGSPAGPSAADVTGAWAGTGSYPNAPFQLTLTQTGTAVRGSYADRHDASQSVSGTLSCAVLTLAVDFGDAQVHVEGTVETARLVRGTMRTSALGNTPFPFTMVR
jgi:hypothetical protein